MNRTIRHRLLSSRAIVSALLIAVLGISLFPVYMMISIALKTPAEFGAAPFSPAIPPHWQNLLRAWTEMDALSALVNSTLVTSLTLVLLVSSTLLAGYSFARRDSALYRVLYLVFLSGAMIPFHLIMIPLYGVVRHLGLIGRVVGVAPIYTALAIPFSLLIMTEFLRSVPRALDESAMIDGASLVRVLTQIILPLATAPISTIVIFNAVWVWNDLIIPLLFLGSRRPTVITALYGFKGFQYTTDWTMVFAGSVITILPLVVVFLALQRFFIRGMVAGALKH